MCVLIVFSIDQTVDVKHATGPHVTGDSAVTGNFFIRLVHTLLIICVVVLEISLYCY